MSQDTVPPPAESQSPSLRLTLQGPNDVLQGVDPRTVYQLAYPAVHPQNPQAGRVEAYVRLRDDIQKRLGPVLVIRCPEFSKFKAPVVILTSEQFNVYPLLEKFFVPEVLSGCERFWKAVRQDLGVETWRPRVNGNQLKALANAHLPETDEELHALHQALNELQEYFKPSRTADEFMQEYKQFLDKAEVWWDGRNRRDTPSTSKRSAQPGLGNPMKRQNNAAGYALVGSHAAFVEHYYPHDDHGATIVTATNHTDGEGMPQQQFLPELSENTPQGVVTLNVGGVIYTTTFSTLLCIRSSWFYPFFHDLKTPPFLPKTAAGDFFIDRDGKVFRYILEYLRGVIGNEGHVPYPEDPLALQSLLREAEFYQLTDLIQRLLAQSMQPPVRIRYYYDSLYLETGYNSIEGKGLKEMEQKKVVVMQQLNQVLAAKQLDGFYVDWCKCGVNTREEPGGGGTMQHNLFYHILLRKGIPVLQHRGA